MTKLKKGGLFLSLTCLFFVITGIPYFYGWFISTPSDHFSGFVHIHEDHMQYYSLAKQAGEGKILFEDRYTLTPHPPKLINWYWWGVGNLMNISGWSIAFTHQLLRFSIVLIWVGTMVVFLGRYLQGPSRLLGLILLFWGGGFGGIVRILQKVSHILPKDFDLLDVWLPENQAFLSLMGTPIYSLAIVSMTSLFLFFLKGMETQRIKYFVLCGSLSFLLLFFHPFEWGVIFTVVLLSGFLCGLAQRKNRGVIFKGIILIALFSLPGLIYYRYLGHQAVFGEVMGQMALTTPDALRVALGFGLPFILALFTFQGIPSLNRVSPSQLLLFSWFVGGFFLLYLPVKFQFHLINGWQIPIYILAVKGLEERIIPYLKNRTGGGAWIQKWGVSRIVYGGVFLLISFTPLYVLQAKIKNIQNHFGQLPYFYRQEEIAALEWLRHHSRPGEGVFSGDQMGNIIPAWTGNKVFSGHYCLTPRYEEKLEVVKTFWDREPTSFNRLEWLKSQGVRYLYWGVEEKNLGAYDPSLEMHLQKVFANNRVTIFQVE